MKIDLRNHEAAVRKLLFTWRDHGETISLSGACILGTAGQMFAKCSIVTLMKNRGSRMTETLRWHRRQAIVLATQLPDCPHDALLVVEALKDLVEKFLAGAAEEGTGPLAANVLPFGEKKIL